MNALLTSLQQRNLIWQGAELASSHNAQQVERSEFCELDKRLDGGLLKQGVIELDSEVGIGELRLLLPFLAKQHATGRVIAFIAPPGVICAEFLDQVGIDISRVLLIQPDSFSDGIWAAEQCVKSGACCAVLHWHNRLTVKQVRRLQLASEQGQSAYFVLTRGRSDASLPIPLRLQLKADQEGVRVSIKKRRGGRPSESFVVSMQQKWPELVAQLWPENVIPFPSPQHVSR